MDADGLRQEGPYVRRLLITVAVISLAYFVWLVSGVLLLAFAAVLLAVLLSGFARLIAEYTPIPETWALTAATIVVALFFATFLTLFGTRIGGQISQLSETLPSAIDAVGNRIGISNASEKLQEAVAAGSRPGMLSRAVGLGYTILGVLADLALVVVAAIYLAADPRLYRRGAVKLLPPSQHQRIFEAMDVTGNALRLWFGGQLVTMTLVGMLSALAYWWIGLPSPLALGLIAGVTNFVPFLGPILGAVPALIFAMTMDLATALWTVAAALAIQQLEGNVITPFIQQRAVSMPPALVLFAILVFGVAFGWLGVFLAVPLAVAITVLVKKLWIRQTLGEHTTVPGENAAD
ncbi:AI-2E family transporter [Microvirga arabica]|uniref:AI-2E family transporter n=1 Tax=Microvirga arabica TaxID=1128671 RepID=UPI00193A75FE|nr:AI-2E family transporter [Microvirga arabica]MBM1170041.1 AI-2E family transporter [Microvirga arabica]